MTKKRVYPQGAITSHLIGYTGKLTENDLKMMQKSINFTKTFSAFANENRAILIRTRAEAGIDGDATSPFALHRR